MRGVDLVSSQAGGGFINSTFLRWKLSGLLHADDNGSCLLRGIVAVEALLLIRLAKTLLFYGQGAAMDEINITWQVLRKQVNLGPFDILHGYSH